MADSSEMTSVRWRAVALMALCAAVAGCSRRAPPSRGVDPDLANPKLQYTPLAPGIEHAAFSRAQPPLAYHVVRIDLQEPTVRLGALKTRVGGARGKETLAEMAQAADGNGRRVVAAINGDYFGAGTPGPWGLHAEKGRLLYSPEGRSAFLVDPGNRPLIARPRTALQVQVEGDPAWRDIRDLNRPRTGDAEGLHLYAQALGPTLTVPATRGAVAIATELPLINGVVTGQVVRVFSDGAPVAIPDTGLLLAWCGGAASPALTNGFRPGVTVRIRTTLTPVATEAVGGGPQIARDGKASLELAEDGIGAAEKAYLRRNHPRAVAGVSRDGRYVYLVGIKGRSDESLGLGLEDTADLMVGIGAGDAVMFDGGDSATLYANGDYLVRGRGGPRAMCNGLAVFSTAPAGQPQPGGTP